MKAAILRGLFTVAALAAAAACSDGSGDGDGSGGNAGATGGGARGADNPPSIGPQVDRAGRAAISTALIETFNADDNAKNAGKDAYNAAGPSQWSNYVDEIETSLAILDSLDTVCGNQLAADDTNSSGRYNTLATVLADDQLYVNSESGTCGTYLGLEAEVVGAVGPGEGGCGGRTPADDVIERSYSVLAAGMLSGIDDTITADDGSQTAEFPYLGAPVGG